MRKLGFYLLLGVSLLSSCSKPDEEPLNTADIPTGSVLVVNEGNFNFGNASITFYHPDSSNVKQDVFTAVNGRPLGDVAYSMSVFDGKAFIAVNNTGKIEVANLADFASLASITGITSPRYILQVGADKAYVSDIYADKLHIIDLNTHTKTGEIALPGWTEDMVEANGNVFVINYDSNRIEVIDPLTDSKINSIPVATAPVSMAKDGNGKLWIISDGGISGPVIPAINRIDPTTMQVDLTIPFADASTNPSDVTISRDGQYLYYLNSDVYRMSINDTQLPAAPYINAGGRQYYAIGISPGDERIYLADAIDFNQQGKAYVYDIATASPVDTFQTGVIPGFFWFVE